MLLGAPARLLDGGGEDGVQALFGDDEFLLESFVALDQLAPAGKRLLELGQNLLKVRLVVSRGDDIVKGLRLFVEAQLPPLEHLRPGGERLELVDQVISPQADHRFVAGEVQLVQRRNFAKCLPPDGPQRFFLRLRLFPPGRGAVVGVHGIAIVLAQGQHQPHVGFRKRIQSLGRGSPLFASQRAPVHHLAAGYQAGQRKQRSQHQPTAA